MLDQTILEELRSVFVPLEGTIELVYSQSSHTQQDELVQLLKDVASTSSHIETKLSDVASNIPQFRIFYQGAPTGVIFSGIPGGHEFSSLVIAILNADKKGKLPDSFSLKRLKKINGPIRLKTYISLSCETCPDVVQTLNQMALFHDDFEHEMIDGAMATQEVDSLGIQGVPSIVSNKQLFHSGKISWLDILVKLETLFGINEEAIQATPTDLGSFDVVVIGGGPAGVTAAIYSARKGLSTALIAEKIGGQVQETRGIENFTSIPYIEGPELSAQLFKHVSSYPVKILEQRRVKKIDAHKTIELDSGEKLRGDTVIVATGAKWRELGIPGEKEYIGRGVAFCPHCDGPFYKGKKVVVVGGGNSGVEAAIDLAGIVKEVVLIEFQPELKADQILVNKLKSLPNTSIMTNTKTKQIIGNGQKVIALEYEDRASGKNLSLDIDGIFVQIGLLPNSTFLKGIVDLTPMGEVVVDSRGRTSVSGIYAAGDVTTIPFKQIVIAMGDGANVALSAFEDRTYAQNVEKEVV